MLSLRGILTAQRKYGVTNAHSSSLTSLGYPVRYSFCMQPCCPKYGTVHNFSIPQE